MRPREGGLAAVGRVRRAGTCFPTRVELRHHLMTGLSASRGGPSVAEASSAALGIEARCYPALPRMG